MNPIDKRDFYAGLAMLGLISRQASDVWEKDDFEETCFRLADRMVEESKLPQIERTKRSVERLQRNKK